MRYLILGLALALTGCAEAMRRAETNAIAGHTDRCERMGYTPGTDALRDCVSRFMAAANR
jgi:hypothetical protein